MDTSKGRDYGKIKRGSRMREIGGKTRQTGKVYIVGPMEIGMRETG